MKLIDAYALKETVAAMALNVIDADKANAMLKMIDLQPTVITGKVKEAEFAYQKITSIKPTEHHYEDPEEEPHIKFSCPVCEAVGNLHQVTPNEKNCPLCGVNLNWEN